MNHSIRDHRRDARIRAMYRDGQTLQGIGTKYGISRERVRQILERLGEPRRKRGAGAGS